MEQIKEITIFEGSQKFLDYLASFKPKEKAIYDSTSNLLSRAMFFHIAKIKMAMWQHNKDFNREIKSSIADMFQEIIAFYLNSYLPSNFKIVLEERKDKLQPDILIYKDNSPHFIIEIKTTVGWDRKSVLDTNLENNVIAKRIDSLSKAFQIKKENILYIFESPENVKASFLSKYWNKEGWKPVESSPKEFPFNQIMPLFVSSDPYYWTYKGSKYQTNVEDAYIWQVSENHIVTRFEQVLDKIIKS